MSWTQAELMAIVLARGLRDGDVVVTGTNAVIPTAAYRLAQLLGAPRIVAMIGAHGTIDPVAGVVPESGADEAFVPGRLVTGLASGLGDQLRGLVDVIFLGGLQVDRRGRCNLAIIGDHDRPRLRGPGTVGLSLVASVPRTLMFFLSHDARTFVETVDFVGADGLRRDGGGLELVVTPLGVLAPVKDRSRIDLKSIHPGVTFADLQARTGFVLDPRRAGVTPSPSRRELAALRSFPDGVRLGTMEVQS